MPGPRVGPGSPRASRVPGTFVHYVRTGTDVVVPSVRRSQLQYYIWWGVALVARGRWSPRGNNGRPRWFGLTRAAALFTVFAMTVANGPPYAAA